MNAARQLEHDWFPLPLPESVTVGERAWIYSSFAFLHNQTTRPGAVRIGHDSGIYHGTFFELGAEAEIVIGDYCALVGAIIRTNGRVSIGDYTFIAHEVVLADGPFVVPPRKAGTGLDSLVTSSFAEASEDRSAATGTSIELGENCWVGMGAVLLAGTKLAQGCVVGAGAVVNFAAPPFSIIAGNPARVVGTAG